MKDDFYSQIKTAEFAKLSEAEEWANSTMANTKYVVSSRIQPFAKVVSASYWQYYLVTIIYKVPIKN